MIVIAQLPGQLGNRLFLNAYAMALAEQSGQKLVDLSLNEYRFLFPATRWRAPQRFHFFLRKLLLVPIKVLRRFPPTRSCFVRVGAEIAEDYSPTNPAFIAGIKSRRLTFIEGFPAPDRFTIPSPQPVRDKFTPDAAVLDMTRKHVAQARTGVDVLVGLHVRRGDYAQFFGGRFHYPTSFYVQVMETMTGFFPGRRVAFLLCTNGPKEFEDNLPYKIIPGPGMAHGALGDLHSLAQCDYIIGPSSTFSLWAAFYGRKPIFQMVTQQLPNSLDDFTIPDGDFTCASLKMPHEEIVRLFRSESDFFKKHKRIKRLYDSIIK